MTLRHVRGFVAVADEGSYTRAAQCLFVTQSSLTAIIKQLESALGLTLFDRTTRRVALTAQGREFLPVAQRLLQDFDAAVRDIRSVAERQRGYVVVAAAPSVVALILPSVAAEYRASYPNITVGVRDGGASAIQQQVLASEIDFGVTNKWSDDPALEFKPLLRDRFYVIAHREHPLSAKRRVAWRELDDYPTIGLAAQTGIQAFLSSVSDLPTSAKEPLYQLSSTAALEALLRQNLGVSVLPALAAQMILSSSLSLIQLGKPIIEREICIITRRGRTLSPAAQSMLQLLIHKLESAVLPAGVTLARASDDTGSAAGVKLDESVDY